MIGDRKAQLVLVDDHPLFRAGLAVALRYERDFDVIGEFDNAEPALDLARRIEIDVAVVDVLMPMTSGISLTSQLFDVQPMCRVLGLSTIDDAGLIADMLRAHAYGFANKTQSSDSIVDAIRQVLGGMRYISPNLPRDLIEAELAAIPTQPLERLTSREREVFELLIRGHSNDEIAIRLFVARRTVETHRQRITKKLSARSIIEMQRLSARYGRLDT